MKHLFSASLLTLALGTTAQAADLSELEARARAEGQVNSVGMPDSWANWKDTWRDLGSQYGLKHQDTDMSSAQEIAKFAAEKEDATADIGDVGAAFALGGDESNLSPALDLFADLARQGRLSPVDTNIANLEKGEIEMAVLWDFNALNYRDQIDRERFTVVIPSDGSLISGYATIINKYAKHPNAAKLAREYILSDAGQINLARGYARPIRSNVTLPDDVQAKLLPNEMYANARPIADFGTWEQSTKRLPRQWQTEVLVHQQR